MPVLLSMTPFITKKPAARESIRDKLKSAQKAQPSHTPKPQKNKGKDMEL